YCIGRLPGCWLVLSRYVRCWSECDRSRKDFADKDVENPARLLPGGIFYGVIYRCRFYSKQRDLSCSGLRMGFEPVLSCWPRIFPFRSVPYIENLWKFRNFSRVSLALPV